MKTCWALIVSTLLTVFALPTFAMEPAVPADDMVESIGVCSHWLYHDTPYGKEFPKAKKLLKELGVRYIRDRFSERNVEIYRDLGIKTTAIVMPPMASYLSLMRQHPDAVAAIEGPNETNIWPITYKGVKGFPDATRLFQDDLYKTVKADPALMHIPVVATSTGYMGFNAKLAPLTSFDYAVIHSYPNGRSPSNLQPSLDNAHKILGVNQPAKRIIATEAGYHTAYGMGSGESQGTTELAKSKLIPRLLTEYFKQGIVRTHIYEFICTHEHQNSSGKRSEAKFGLVTHYMTPTASYTAMKNFITILKDPNTSFTPRALDFKITSEADAIHHLLMQKADGTYYLLLWNDVEVYNADVHHPDYGKDIYNPDVPVTVNLPNMPMQDVQLYRPNRSDKPMQTIQPTQQLYLNVPDDMLIVTFKLPQTKVKPVASPRNLTATATTSDVNLSWDAPENNPEIKGYFVTSMGKSLGFTTQTMFQDTVTLPGIGYTYTVQAVDQLGNVSQPVEHVVMTPAVFPDIVVTKVTMIPENPKAGESVTFKATIKNIGKYDSPAITHGIAFRIDQRMACWADSYKTPLAPGEQITLTANSGPGGNQHWIAVKGKHTLTAHVDDQDRFREDDESNNKLSLPIEID
ncbi:MAG: CARDB domain-containing protein [Phycisphaeraceae bacterium JB051]